eukprot:5162090-Amphidinium_carterae.1
MAVSGNAQEGQTLVLYPAAADLPAMQSPYKMREETLLRHATHIPSLKTARQMAAHRMVKTADMS